MSASSISAGRAFLSLLVDDKKFGPGLDAGIKKLDSFGKSALKIGATLSGVGAAITAPFVASLKIFSDVGGELADLKGRTGLTAESLTTLKYAATQTGVSLGVITTAARELKSKGLDPNLIFEYARSIAAIEDPVQRSQAAMELFGKRTGDAILPLLVQLRTLQDEARRMGLVWDEEMISKADRLSDAMSALKAQFTAVATAIGSSVAPYISKLAESLQAPLGMIIKWIRVNPGLVAALGASGVAIGALSTAIVVVGAVSASFTAALAALTATAAAVAAPMGLAVAGITALGIAIVGVLQYTLELDRAIGSLMSQLGTAIGTFNKFLALKGMIDKINKGTIPTGIAAPAPDATPGVPGRTGAPAAFDPNAWRGMDVALQGQGAAGMFGPALSPFALLKDSGMLDEIEAQLKDQANLDRIKKKPAWLDDRQGMPFEIPEMPSRPTVGTFNGRLAGQVIGGTNDPAAHDRKKQIELAKEAHDHLKEIRLQNARERWGLINGNL